MTLIYADKMIKKHLTKTINDAQKAYACYIDMENQIKAYAKENRAKKAQNIALIRRNEFLTSIIRNSTSLEEIKGLFSQNKY